MVVRKERKSRKLRGRSRTMGWGRVGQHRKSGSRGGFGAVGLHKHKVVWMIKHAPHWYGKHGFTSVWGTKKALNVVNVGELNELAQEMLSKNAATREGDLVVIDVASMGYSKVLGKGKVTLPLKVIAKEVSEIAKAKINRAGGVVVLAEGESRT
ncbi:MAG: uL15 family ribosomal protein [Desulfurococcaceae archaeon]